MKKRTSFFLQFVGIILFLSINIAYAQNPIWTLPNKYNESGVLRTLPTPSTDPNFVFDPNFGDPMYYYQGQSAEYAHNSMVDAQGKLLFFIIDGIIYNGEGYMIGILEGISGVATGTSEVCIVPDPGNCSRYYIFYSWRDWSTMGGVFGERAFYTILDMGINNTQYEYSNGFGKGGLVNQDGEYMKPINNTIAPGFLPGGFSGKQRMSYYAASKKQNDAHFIYITNGDGIFVFKLDESGFYFTNQVLNYPNPYKADFDWSRRFEMEVVSIPHQRQRIAVPLVRPYATHTVMAIYTNVLDANGVPVPGEERIFDLGHNSFYSAEIKGLEFSESGRYLYLTHEESANRQSCIEFISFANPENGVQPMLVPNSSDFQFSQIERGIDGKMYFVGASNGSDIANRLATLSNTDIIPNSAIWTDYVLPISYSASYFKNYLNDNIPFTKSFTLPDQIDGFDYYSVYTENIECCIDTRISNDYLEVSQNQTWTTGMQNAPFVIENDIVYVRDELRIKAGAILTLSNMEFRFAPNAKVIVERGTATQRGGKLVLNNTTFTVDARCANNLMWQGVEVQGRSNLDQTHYHSSPTLHQGAQGLIYLHNNSRIEHAKVGVYLGMKVSSPFLIKSNGGGAIISVNSTFYNNQRDVEFTPYSRTNRSWFANTTFITDGSLNDNTLFPTSHVLLRSVNNVRFNSCHFENTNDQLNLASRLGKGIESFNSKFFVNGTATLPTRFVNLYVGVWASSLTNSMTFEVDRSAFINNYKGIYVSGVENQIIQRNHFEVRKNFIPTISLSSTIGLHMINSTGYDVWENHFEEHAEGPSQGSTIGILVDNSGVEGNLIYKNTFENLKIGGQSQNINSEPYISELEPNNIGLVWKCNNFQTIYKADLGVSSGRIAYQQGHILSATNPLATKAAAGNIFSHSGNNPTNDFWANPGVLDFNYAHHNNDFTTPYDYSIDIINPQIVANGQILYSSASCPSKIRRITVLDRIPLYTTLGRLKESLEEKDSKIDGGNTEALIAQLSNSSLSIGEKKDKVVAVSPYLTDAVLKYYLELNPPAGHVNQVVGLNSPVSAEIWSIVEEMNLPKGIIRQLGNLQSGKSPLEELRNEYNYEKSEANLIVDELISSYLLDTTLVGAMDSVKFLYETEKTGITRVKNLLSWYLTQEDYTNAQTMLDTYIANYGEDNYTKIVRYTIEAETTSCASTYVAEEVSKKEMMETIAHQTNDKKNCHRAQDLLELALAQEFDYEIEPLIEMMGSRSMQTSMQTELLTADEENEMIKLFPNPAKDEFFVVLDESSENLASVEITMYSFTGQQVKQVQSTDRLQTIAVPVNDLSQGMYLVVVTLNGEVVSQQKMAVK